MSGRDAAGRFASGFSPDRGRGRVAAPQGADMTAFVRRSIMDAANMPVRMRESAGRRWRTVSLFELMVRRLASGQTSRRRSVVPFIKLVMEAAMVAPPTEPVSYPEPPDLELVAAKEELDAAMAEGVDDDIEDALTQYLTLLRNDARRRSTW